MAWWTFGSKSVSTRLEDLETAVKRLSGERKALEQEWESVYEKYRVAMSKLARRDIRAATQDAPESANGNEQHPPPPGPPLMSPRAFFGRK